MQECLGNSEDMNKVLMGKVSEGEIKKEVDNLDKKEDITYSFTLGLMDLTHSFPKRIGRQ